MNRTGGRPGTARLYPTTPDHPRLTPGFWESRNSLGPGPSDLVVETRWGTGVVQVSRRSLGARGRRPVLTVPLRGATRPHSPQGPVAGPRHQVPVSPRRRARVHARPVTTGDGVRLVVTTGASPAPVDVDTAATTVLVTCQEAPSTSVPPVETSNENNPPQRVQVPNGM